MKNVSITFALSTEAVAVALSHTKSLQFTLPYFTEVSNYNFKKDSYLLKIYFHT